MVDFCVQIVVFLARLANFLLSNRQNLKFAIYVILGGLYIMLSRLILFFSASPLTSDDKAPIWVYLVLLAVASAGIAGVITYIIRRKRG